MADLKIDGLNEVKKGKKIYSIGEEVNSISVIISGRVLAFEQGSKFICMPGSVLGISDLDKDSYEVNYMAVDDVQLYTLNIRNSDEIIELLDESIEYRYKIINGLNYDIAELYKIYCEYEKMASGLKVFMNNTYRMLSEFAKNSGITIQNIDIIKNMPIIELEDFKNRIEYYVNVNNMEEKIKKVYFLHSTLIAYHHIEEEIEIINKLFEDCEKLNSYIQGLTLGLVGKDECLLGMAAQLTIDARKLKYKEDIPFSLFEKIKKKCNEIEILFSNRSGRKLDILKERIEQISELFNDGSENALLVESKERSSKTTVKYAGTDINIINREVDKTFEKLVEYGELEENIRDEFRRDVVSFIKLADRTSTEDDVRKLRQKLTLEYYNLYEKVFLKRCEDENDNRIVDLFLIYGLLDERLLTKDQIVELYCFDEQNDDNSECRVYNTKQWLEAIYKGEKEPSKNEFDLDYQENLRELKKNKEITDNEYNRDLENGAKKVSFEIRNMIRNTSRIVCGQASIFVPFLYKENFMGHLDQSIMTADQIRSLVMDVRDADYSLFYRERMISEPAAKIEKEYIQEEILPDIILVPVYGSNAAMWQDIEGRRRSSHSRFIFPIFSEVDMEDNVIRLCGRYRWEICKTIQGINWNNIQMKSLTSEYMDYLQFYKKNHNLSDEKKEKLKLQIQKGRGNFREIFVLDYLSWIKNESRGGMRLNKVAREIFSTYCPFNVEIRKKLITQPLFEEAMAKYRLQKNRKIKELNMRYQNYKNKGIEILPSMEKTLNFYENL